MMRLAADRLAEREPEAIAVAHDELPHAVLGVVQSLDQFGERRHAGERLFDVAHGDVEVHVAAPGRADVDAAVAACVDAFGGVDILVNNAGTTHRNQSMLDVDEATFDRVFAVNVKSIFHTTQTVVPLMKARRSGCIVNIGSTAGIRPRPGLTWYNASKGAVNLLSKSMAAELGPDGIRVNAVCPVMSPTALIEQFLGVPDTPEARAKVVAGIPLGRMSTPEDVAEATLYLASDAARFITGVELPVDGGRTI